MEEEDKACIDDFIQTLHTVAEEDFWQNITIRVSTEMYLKDENRKSTGYIDEEERVRKYRRPLGGSSVKKDDGSILIRFVSGEQVIVTQEERNYRAALAYHIKLNNPDMMRKDIAEISGFRCVSSVDKGIARLVRQCCQV